MADQPLRIIHVDNGRHWRGSQHQIVYTMRGQADKGHKPTLVCPPDVPLADEARHRGLRVVPVRMKGNIDPLGVLRLYRVFREHSPHVVHLQCSNAHVLGGIAARLARVPAVILSRRLDNPIDNPIRRWKYRHGYDAIIAVSDGVKNVLMGAEILPERIYTVRSSVPESIANGGDGGHVRAELGLGRNNVLLTVLAHIERRKGIDTLVDAMPQILAAVPYARALVVGGGSYRPEIQRRVAQMGIQDTVILPGFRKDIADILAASDIILSPSYLEGCCNALMEGMAAGKPVIGTAVGGTPELIEDGLNGLLISPKDPDALAGAVVRIITDPELAKLLASNARATAKEKFSIDRMVNDTLEVYYRVLEQKGLPCRSAEPRKAETQGRAAA